MSVRKLLITFQKEHSEGEGSNNEDKNWGTKRVQNKHETRVTHSRRQNHKRNFGLRAPEHGAADFAARPSMKKERCRDETHDTYNETRDDSTAKKEKKVLYRRRIRGHVGTTAGDKEAPRRGGVESRGSVEQDGTSRDEESGEQGVRGSKRAEWTDIDTMRCCFLKGMLNIAAGTRSETWRSERGKASINVSDSEK